MPAQSPKRRHHFLPQFYLKGFVDPSEAKPKVWVLRLGRVEPFSSSPVNVALETDFYGTENAPDAMEEDLSRREAAWAPALRQFLAGETAISDVLAEFLGWLASRTPWLRRQTERELPRFLTEVAFGRAEIRGGPKPQIFVTLAATGEDKHLEFDEALAMIRVGAAMPKATRLDQMDMMRLQAWYFQREQFPRFRWVKLTVPPGYSFITTDRPLAWHVCGRLSDSPAALKEQRVELTVPLSATVALVGTKAAGFSTEGVHAHAFNRNHAAFAEQFIVGRDRETVLRAAQSLDG